VSDWTDIVAIAAGSNHTVGLKSDGTVITVGSNIYGQCDVSDWVNIVAIVAG
jgi:alpha-tubulin suppressor-like RCC1 family protein